MKIEITNLNKSYNGVPVLCDIGLQIQDVSAVGIIGESGCGKSTLLRQLSGIEDPDEGKISINGLSPILDKISFQENIGYVFQQHNLFPHLTIKKNITLILNKVKKLDKAEAEEIANSVLERMYISGEADKLPRQVSGGQAQRGAIARALATNPKLIFLDEPTAALDPVMSNEVLKAVADLKSDGREFIFVTHEISFLKRFADYVVFMKNGRLCEWGEVSCLSEPKTKELEDFLSVH